MRVRLSLLALLLLSLSLAAIRLPVVNILYFYSNDCPHCIAVRDEVLQPMQQQYGERLAVSMFEINTPANYEGMLRATTYFQVPDGKRAIPALVIGDKILIGEEEIRAQLPGLVQAGLESGVPWPPSAAGLDGLKNAPTPAAPASGLAPAKPLLPAAGTPAAGACSVSGESSGCATAKPIYAAYFYRSGCEVCDIAKNDLAYARQKHPNLIVDEYELSAQPDMALWLAQRAGKNSMLTPAVFIGQDALIGSEQVTPASLEALVTKYAATGAEEAWKDFTVRSPSFIQRFRALGAPAYGLVALAAAVIAAGAWLAVRR